MQLQKIQQLEVEIDYFWGAKISTNDGEADTVSHVFIQ